MDSQATHLTVCNPLLQARKHAFKQMYREGRANIFLEGTQDMQDMGAGVSAYFYMLVRRVYLCFTKTAPR